jgi:hypothetical protein
MTRPRAKGLIREAGRMNNTEREYSRLLESRKCAGEVHAWWFEALNLRLGQKCFYKPDFLVQLADGTLEIHEVKGHWERESLARTKVAADKYPFTIIAVSKRLKKDGGGWQVRRFSGEVK